MTPDRMDDLLDRALETGVIPDDATAEERAELETLLSEARVLRTERETVDRQAAAAKPVARARFERQIGNVAPVGVRSATRSRKRGRFAFGFGAIAAVVAILLVAVVAVRPFSNAETANALSVDDYVQIPGVVSATGDGRVTVTSSEFGDIEVLVSELTNVLDGEISGVPGDVVVGDGVLVSGLVLRGRPTDIQIDARTVVRGGRPSERPVRERLDELRNFREGVAGKLTVLVLAPDGEYARVVIETPGGRRVLVNASQGSIERLLEANGSPVGMTVRVGRGDEQRPGVFDIVPVDETPPAEEPGGSFITIRGVLESRRANVFQVRTERGLVPAVIRPHSRILLGESGLTLEDVRSGERVIGHGVRVTGGLERGTGRLIVDVAVVGPKP